METIVRLIDADALIEFVKGEYWCGSESARVEILEEIEILADEYKNREIERLKKELEFAKHEATTSHIINSLLRQ